MIRPVKIVTSGDKVTCDLLIGRGKSEMALLENQMNFQNLKQGWRTVRPFPGVTIQCSKIFDQRTVIISVAPSRFLPTEEELYEYIKIFVHVDVINQEDWNTELTDTLTRSLMTSAISCGIADMKTGVLANKYVTSTTYLAEGSTGTWSGVYGTLAADVNEAITYYNDLFSYTPYYSTNTPVITDRWVDTTYSTIWVSGYNLYQLGASYTCTLPGTPPYECEKTTAAASGWCNDVFYRYDEEYTSAIEPQVEEIIEVGDLYKLVTHVITDELTPCSKNVFYYRKEYPYGAYGGTNLPMNPYGHTHQFCFEDTEDYEVVMNEIMFYYRHWSHTSPILGELWNGLIYEFNRETWTRVFCGTVDHVIGYELREMRKSGNALGESSYTMPCTPNTIYTNKNFLLNDIGNELNGNYLANGFGWYCGIAGGLFGAFDHESIRDGTSTVYVGNENFRTLVRVSAAYGIGISPWGDRVTDAINDTLATLIKDAIVQAGGTVYNNADIPVRADSNWSDYMLEYGDVVPKDIRAMNGVVYASPVLNIKIYAIPVKG